MTTVNGASFRNGGNGRVGFVAKSMSLGVGNIARRTFLTGFSAEVMSRFDDGLPKFENDPSLERACGFDRAVEYIRLVDCELSNRGNILNIESEKYKGRVLEAIVVSGKTYSILFPTEKIAAKVFRSEITRLIQERLKIGFEVHEAQSKWENNMLQIAACARLLALEENVPEEIMEKVYLSCFRFRDRYPTVTDAYEGRGYKNIFNESDEAYLAKLCLDAVRSFLRQDSYEKSMEMLRKFRQ
jgi:hypothetical protein